MPTHDELAGRAGRWLRNTMRCKAVFVGAKPWACAEHADAIGWLPNGESIVVECKVSMADYKHDYRKQWRTTSTGMGFRKYYMVPEDWDGGDRWRPADGCGLLVCKGRRVIVQREAPPRQERCWREEVALLLSNVQPGIKGNNDADED